MLKLFPKQLKEKFISSMIQATDFEYQNGNPFFIKLSGVPYLIFLKNLSCAYFKGSPDITRIQLPYLEIFNQTFQDGIPLIVLGYDSDNDVYVGWNPERIKQRINSKNNVSLYSRVSVQEKSKTSSFNEGQLTTGERFYAFHNGLLPQFFNSITDLFREDNKLVPIEKKVVEDVFEHEILIEVTDESVLIEILPLLKEAKILETASICFKHYSRKYPSMSLTDWLNVAKRMYDKLV